MFSFKVNGGESFSSLLIFTLINHVIRVDEKGIVNFRKKKNYSRRVKGEMDGISENHILQKIA